MLSNAYHPVHIELRNRNGQLLTATTSTFPGASYLKACIGPRPFAKIGRVTHLTAARRSRTTGRLGRLVRPQALPGLWLGYHGVSAVAVSGTFQGALSVAKPRHWPIAAAGGTLILAGGSSTEAPAPAALRQLWRVGLSGATRRLPAGAADAVSALPEDADLVVWEARKPPRCCPGRERQSSYPTLPTDGEAFSS